MATLGIEEQPSNFTAAQMNHTSSLTSSWDKSQVNSMPLHDWWLDLLQSSERVTPATTTTKLSTVAIEHAAYTYSNSPDSDYSHTETSMFPNDFQPSPILYEHDHDTQQQVIFIEGGCLPSTRVKSEVSICESAEEYH